MRAAIAAVLIAISAHPAEALSELNGKWRLQNGAPATIQNGTWTIEGYSAANYGSYSGWIRKIGPNTYEFGGQSLSVPRRCTLANQEIRCTVSGAVWRRR
jgi:hypothetical protein